MACSINYLKQRYTGDELQALVNHHYQIKDELANSKFFQKDKNGVLQYFKHKLVPEAIAKIGSINARYRAFVPQGTKIVHMDSNGLKINVLPIADKVIEQNITSAKANSERHIENPNNIETKLYYDTANESDKEPNSQEAEENLESSKGYFDDIIKRVKLRIRALEESLKERPYAKAYKEDIADLKSIVEHENELKFISNYIAHSSGFLKSAKKEFEALKEKYKNSTNLTQKEVLDFNERLNEIREFLHFYTDLSEINTIIKQNDINLQEETKDIIKEVVLQTYSEEVYQALDDTDLTSVSSVDKLYTKLKNLLVSPAQIEELKSYINTINDKNLTVDKQLKLAIDNQAAIVNEMKEYSIKLMSDWLYPYIEVTNKRLIETGYEDDAISKKELESLLAKAKKDVGYFARNLGATISNEDPVTALVALALKDLIYRAKNQTNDAIYSLTNLYAEKNVNKADIETYHNKYLRKAKIRWFKYNDKGEKIFKDENGIPYYTEVDALYQDKFYDKYDSDFTKFKVDLNKHIEGKLKEFWQNPEQFINDSTVSIFISFDGVVTIDTYREAWIREYERKVRGKAIAEWHAAHSDIREDAESYLEEKQKEMSDKRFENWLRTNARIITEKEYGDAGAGGFSLREIYEEKGHIIPERFTQGMRLKEGQFLVYAGKFTVPNKELYENNTPEYLAIKDDPYYKELNRIYSEANDVYSRGRDLPYGVIPQMAKDLSMKEKYLDDKNKPDGKKIKQALEDSIVSKEDEQEIVEKDEEGNEIKIKVSRVKQNVDGSVARNVPVRYTAIFDDQTKVNRNLLETIIEYANAANHYKAMSTVEPNIEILKSVINGDRTLGIKAREVKAVNSKGNPIVSYLVDGIPKHLLKEKGIRLNEMLTDFIDDIVYGESEEKASINIMGTDYSLNKLGNNLGFITSMYSMAGNITSGINNLVLGNINTFSEAIGGKYYTKDDWWNAHKTYWKSMGTGVFFNDLVENNWNKKSLLTQMQVHFDAFQGEFLDTRGKIQTGTLLNKLMTKDTLFFNQHITEHEIQMKGMIAMMNGYKIANVLDENGNTKSVSLFDAYEISSTGKMQVKEEYKNIVTPEVEMDFRNKLHAINKQHHGNYNKFDKAALQRKWYGKLALMFRKYLYTSFKARLGSKQVDYEIGDITQGYYNVSARLVGKFYTKLRKDIKDNKEWMTKKYFTEGLTDNEKYAVKKTAAELSFLMVANMVILGLSAMELDDDDDVLNFVHLQSRRVQQDLLTFIPPYSFTPLLRVFTNPSAAFNVIEKVNELLQQLFTDPFATYSRDTGIAEKGDSKLSVKFQKVLPIWRQIVKLRSAKEELKYYDLLQSGSAK